ncbi:uncharacterized protein N7503_004540 [Penicillium pulvis]|uniref:uncharacterized protein n=1 Tax=Penicillium pulvis TaxID=1562058 RepID=UPI0025493F80|nr:uncharacterized protein N7503_004540 [Penicillium pulvis]KAJ5802090.1 hypothetical protein N7503_004540 [Penicillium pulvis]
MSNSDISLSPTISSRFTTFYDAKASLETRLNRYQGLDGQHDDDTLKLLTATFKYLPQDGRIHFADDVDDCVDDDALRQLADSLDTGLLRPMLSQGGQTPSITPSPRFAIEYSIEDLHGQDIESATRNDQPQLRASCLKRDGHRCVITQCWDRDFRDRESDDDGPLEAAHIIPFTLGRYYTDDERRYLSCVWVNIFRYFPSVRARLNLSLGDINRIDNMMMLTPFCHAEFGAFRFVLEETPTPNRYRVKKFPRISGYYSRMLPPVMTFINYDPQHALPNPELIAVHAAIGNILNASGRGDKIEKLIRDLGEGGQMLSPDGSTSVGDLLSVTELSTLLSVSNLAETKHESEKAKPRRAPAALPGAENQRSDATTSIWHYGAYPQKDEEAAWVCEANSPIVTAKLVTTKPIGDNQDVPQTSFINSVEFILAADNLGQLPGWPLDVETVRFLSDAEEQNASDLPALVESAPKPGRNIWSMKGFYGEYTDGLVTQLSIVWGRS